MMFILKSKRCLLTLLLAYAVLGSYSIQAMERFEVHYPYIVDEAKKLSQSPYDRQLKPIPKELLDLNYDDYLKLRFIENRTLWRNEGLAFQAQFFHLGYLYKEPVELDEFTETHMQRIPYMSEFFDLKDLPTLMGKLTSDLDYAGFKILYRLNLENNRFDELIAFLGASYYRSIGADMHYGISARGLAVDCGLSSAEEFPRFTHFWLKKPLGDSKSMMIYALLDSPSVTGAYEFIISPGKTTRIDVKATLFMRENVKSLGIAPLTSMFWFGENSWIKPSNPHPEVHDSDGLKLKTADGDLVWRPLDTSSITRHTYLNTDSPAGFGLMQRDRAYSSYHDLQSEYHRRPSLWVEPRGNWGKGRVHLLELPINSDVEDNIVAYWEPEIVPKKGSQQFFSYSLYWSKDPVVADNSRPFVSSTRSGYEGQNRNEIIYILEFSPGSDSSFSEKFKPNVEAKVSGSGSLGCAEAQWNPQSSTWRVTLKIKILDESKEPFELSCRLIFSDKLRSELWCYQCSP